MPIRSCPKAQLETLAQGSSSHCSGGSSSHHGWQNQDLLSTHLSGGCNRLLTQGLYFAVLWDASRETAPSWVCSSDFHLVVLPVNFSTDCSVPLRWPGHGGTCPATGRFKRYEQTANSSILMQPLNSENPAFFLPQTHFSSLGLNFWAILPTLTEVTARLCWQAWQTRPLVQPSQDSERWETYAHIFLLHHSLTQLHAGLPDCPCDFSRGLSPRILQICQCGIS